MTEVALVTGSSGGMGLHAAVGLATRGHTVVAGVRNPARADALRTAAADAGVELDVVALDVTDHDAARRVVAGIAERHGPVSVLVNNAGRGSVATAEQLTLEQVQAQLDVNYLGPVVLTQAVLPAMREAGRGRILTVTSVGGVVGQPFAEAYCGSKFAVEGFMQALSTLALAFGVWVSVIEPAAVASDFVANSTRDLEPDATDAYSQLLAAYLERTGRVFAMAQPAGDAGRAIVDAVTADTYRFRWQTGEAARTFAAMSLADLDGARVLAATQTWTS